MISSPSMRLVFLLSLIHEGGALHTSATKFNNQPVPFSVLGGGPFVELPSRLDSQWAVDATGALWECHLSGGNLSPWTNYTDPDDITVGNRAIEVTPPRVC